MATINSNFGSGGLLCTLSDAELGQFILRKVMDFMTQPGHRVLQAVETIGQQDVHPPVFVLSAEVSIHTATQLYSQ